MRIFFAAGCSVALALGGCQSFRGASSPEPRDELGYGVVRSLTTEVGSRLAGTAKEAEARTWAVAKLKSLKFDRVSVEPFRFHGWQRGSGSADIVGPVTLSLAVLALGGSVATPAHGITAPVAFVASYDELLKAAPSAFAGKIVFINDRMMRARDGAGYRSAIRKRSNGGVEAARRGALAVVIRSAGTDSNRFAHTGMMDYDKAVRKIPGAAVSGPDADQIERLHEMGKTVRLKLVLRTRDLPMARSGNVVGDIVGRELPNEIVLISGHLDSWDPGTGAIDDGAGVAIAIAAAIKAAGPAMKPKRTIRVVLFGAEEFGGDGGAAYANAHAAEVSHHVLAMESDFGAGAPWRFDTNVPAAELPFYESVYAALSPLGIERGKNETRGGTDIAPLIPLGVKVIAIGQDGTNYFDLHHTANDTLDKIDPAALELNVEAYARATAMVVAR